MAKIEVIFLIAALYCAVGAVLLFSPAFAAEDDEDDSAALSPGPWYPDSSDFSDLELPPEPSSGYYKFMDQCAKKMNPACGDEIFSAMFMEESVTKYCCTNLVDMGKECHDGLVKMLLQIPELKPDGPKALVKSAQIWNACVFEAASPSPF